MYENINVEGTLKESLKKFGKIYTKFPRNCLATLKKSLKNSGKICEKLPSNILNILEQL